MSFEEIGYDRAGRTDGPIDKENRLLGRYVAESVVIKNFGNLHFAGTVDGLAKLVVVDECDTGAAGAKDVALGEDAD